MIYIYDGFSVNLTSGSSIAGLVTARVCHDHFERVVIVEPEAWLATPEGWDPAQQPQKSKRTRILQYESIQGQFIRYIFCHILTIEKRQHSKCLGLCVSRNYSQLSRRNVRNSIYGDFHSSCTL
jgi:hypothetical protein